MYKGFALISARSTWRQNLLLLAGLFLLPPAQSAEKSPSPVLRVCIADQDVPPFSHPHAESQVQQALRHAARRHGWQVTYSVRPWLRCQVEAGAGKFDALIPIAPAERNLQAFVFPTRDGQPDPGRSLGEVRAVAARQVGSSASWDGEHFTGVQGPVIYLQGMQALSEQFSQAGVAATSTRTSVDMVRMLLAGRGNLVVDIEPRLRQTLDAAGAGERVQILPQVVLTRNVYLAVTPPFYQQHKTFVERIWRETAGADEQPGFDGPLAGPE